MGVSGTKLQKRHTILKSTNFSKNMHSGLFCYAIWINKVKVNQK